MKLIQKALCVSVLTMLCSSAWAFGICTHPLPNDCLIPQWGQVDPTIDSESLNANGQPVTAMRSQVAKPAIQMIPAAYSAPKPSGKVDPKVIVDDGAKFKVQTDALIAAIKRASFNKDGELISGRERIEAASERLKKVSAGHQLSLYLKTQQKLKPDAAKALGDKVTTLNDVLGGPKSK